MSRAEVEAVRQTLQGIQASLPPGTDVYAVVQDFLDAGVFPELGRPFWIQYHINIAVCGLAILVVTVSLAIQARKGRLHYIVHDNSCTRIDLKFAVPLLWTLGAIIQIGFAHSFRKAYTHRRITRVMGTLWYMCYIPPAISFTLLSTSLAAGTPPLRRYLNRISHGALRYSLAVAFCVLCTLASLIPPAFRHGIPLAEIGEAYTRASEGVQAAKDARDTEALFSLADEIIQIELKDADYRIASRIVNGIYAAYLLIYLITGIVSFTILRQTVYKKIARLEGGSNPTLNTFGDASCVADDPRSPTVNVQLKEIAPSNASIVQLPLQPADRPFAQLLGRGTTALPRRFHVILQAKDQPTSNRAQQLRSTLSHDLKLLLGYLCLVLSPLALSLFMSLGGQETLNAVESWHLSYTWTVWNLAIPALTMACLLLREALYPPATEEDVVVPVATLHKRKASRNGFPVADVNGIQCEQVINVAYGEPVAHDYSESDKMETKYRY